MKDENREFCSNDCETPTREIRTLPEFKDLIKNEIFAMVGVLTGAGSAFSVDLNLKEKEAVLTYFTNILDRLNTELENIDF